MGWGESPPDRRMGGPAKEVQCQSQVSSRAAGPPAAGWAGCSTAGLSTQHLPAGNPGSTRRRKCHGGWGRWRCGGGSQSSTLPGKAGVSSLQSSPGRSSRRCYPHTGGAPARGGQRRPGPPVAGRRATAPPAPHVPLAAHLLGARAQGCPPPPGPPTARRPLGHSAAKQRPPGHGPPGGLLVGGQHGPGLPVGRLRGPLSRSRIEQQEEGRPQEACSGLSMGAAAPSP